MFTICRVRSSVRPVCAKLMAAGPDGVRWPDPTQSNEREAPTAPRVVPALAAAFRSSSSIQCAPLQFGAAPCAPRLFSGRSRGSIEFTERHHRPDGPGGLVGHGDSTTRAGLRSSRLRIHSAARYRRFAPVGSPRSLPRPAASADSRSPIFEMRPSRSLPPEEFWRGTSPRKAANSRPERNGPGSVTAAARAVAVMMPMPGIAFRAPRPPGRPPATDSASRHRSSRRPHQAPPPMPEALHSARPLASDLGGEHWTEPVHHSRTFSWQVSIPRSNSRSSTFRSPVGTGRTSSPPAG